MSTMNLTLLTDLYELTMMQGLLREQRRTKPLFSMPFTASIRAATAFALSAGLDQVIDYIKNLRFDEEDIAYLRSLHCFTDDFLDYLANFHFSGDILRHSRRNGHVPREPMIKVIAPIMEAQLVKPPS